MTGWRQGAASPRRAWAIVVLLSLLYALSSVDRYILGLLADPVAKSLGLSDRQMGLALGAGFAVVYAIAGLPIARWIDRKKRKPIIVAGILLWGSMTILCAFTRNFGELMLVRGGLAIGEAVLTPAAMSLIADLFPAQRRGSAVATYSSMGSIMITGTLLVGSLAFDVATHVGPGFGLEPWRMTMIFVGAPSILLGLLFLVAVREPERGTYDAPAKAAAPAGGLPAELRRQPFFYAAFFAGTTTLAAVVLGVTAWLPTMAVRAGGLSPSEAGYLLGITGIPTILVGSFLWPWISQRRTARAKEGPLSSFAAALLVGGAIASAALLFADPAALLAVALLLKTCTGTLAVMPPLIIQTYGAAHVRARLIALSLMLSGIVGYSLGPLLVPLLGDLFAAGPLQLARGGGLIATALMPLAALLVLQARRRRSESEPPAPAG